MKAKVRVVVPAGDAARKRRRIEKSQHFPSGKKD
jgi:hypothetical protein